ncbi:MAG: M17 family metallopeptidase [Rhodospirillaceae bacterium]
MLAKLEQHADPLRGGDAARHRHIVMVLPKSGDFDGLARVPHIEALKRVLARRKKKPADIASSAVTTDLPDGGLASWVMIDDAKPVFERQTAMRKAIQALLGEHPRELAVAVFGSAAQRVAHARLAVYVAWVNGVRLPQRKKKPEGGALQRVHLYGARDAGGYAALRAQALGNVTCRELTALPPNELTPAAYRERIRALAREHGWQREEYDLKRLRKLGAGAFVAVAQGSPAQDAAIVHLRYRARGARKTIALIGKGICFDTGGHNLKPARYMHGMHEDMNGSAVALGALIAATEARLPINIDCWLAIAENHISPQAYRQNEVVTALNGTTIEVMHTDAEGRMVLSDTLTLAGRARPDVMIAYATLTGSMHVALGDRYSGVFATSDELGNAAIAAGRASGERVCLFPLDEDYDSALDSDIADVKQCTLEGNADHILAARFLKRFTEDRPWLHVDLSGSSCKGGLGAVGTDITGFGVAWTASLVERLLER